MLTCPTCTGRQLAEHPAGWLAWQHELTCPTQAAEDATKAADHASWTTGRLPTDPDTGATLDGYGFNAGTYTRPATTTERRMLAILGHTLPEALTTHVRAYTPSILRRTWPVLEDD